MCIIQDGYAQIILQSHETQAFKQSMRNPMKYQLNKANTERYRKSTIPYLQRLLNKENLKRKAEVYELQTFNNVQRKKMLKMDKN